MPMITAADGERIYYKDWGEGPVICFSHGWPLNSEAWDNQLDFLARNGFRAIAHDRRGHGRSSQASNGNTMDGYADDLAALIEALDLEDVTLVGHSTGGGEVTRYIGRHGTSRLAGAVLIAAVPPIMLKTEANPEGIPMAFFDQMRRDISADRSQFYREIAPLFFGSNREGSSVSEGILDQFWLQCLQAGLHGARECIAAFSETDFTQDLKRFDIPTLFIHGDDDQIVPIDIASRKAARLVPGAQEIYYPSGPHGLMATHVDRLNEDLLAFLKTLA